MDQRSLFRVLWEWWRGLRQFLVCIQCHQILYFCCWTGNEFSSWHCGFLRYQHWNSSHTVLRNQLTTKSLTADYEPLIDKIWDCMLCWTNRSLSFAGRLQLIKSVISNIVNFWSSAFILPAKCLETIESMCSAFLWPGSPTQTLSQQQRRGISSDLGKLWYLGVISSGSLKECQDIHSLLGSMLRIDWQLEIECVLGDYSRLSFVWRKRWDKRSLVLCVSLCLHHVR